MAVIVDIKNVRKMLSGVKKEGRISVIVGYTQNYAIYVHENLEAHHPIGQAKFLEQPARELPLGNIVAEHLKAGGTLKQSLVNAGLRLQRESQKLVPVDTGALKNSAFTRVEK